jgi:hypothetical protein
MQSSNLVENQSVRAIKSQGTGSCAFQQHGRMAAIHAAHFPGAAILIVGVNSDGVSRGEVQPLERQHNRPRIAEGPDDPSARLVGDLKPLHRSR